MSAHLLSGEKCFSVYQVLVKHEQQVTNAPGKSITSPVLHELRRRCKKRPKPWSLLSVHSHPSPLCCSKLSLNFDVDVDLATTGDHFIFS